MQTIYRLGLLLALLGLSISIASAQSAQSQSIEAYLNQYINALNTHDYRSAYTMIDNRSDSYEDFAAGYAHTLRIVPYFGFAGAAAGSTYVTSILLGYQDDGSIETYYGYFQLHSGQLYDPIRNDGGWVIGSARFTLLADGDAPHNNRIADLLSRPWEESAPITPTPSGVLPTISEMNREMSRALLGYYDLVNAGQFATSYNSWLGTAQGFPHSYALPYADYVNGYAETSYVTVYAGAEQASTSSYIIGFLPTVLVGEQDDGSFAAYSGCYALGRFSNGVIGIINGKFSLLKEDAPTSTEIFEALDSLNCAALNMGV